MYIYFVLVMSPAMRVSLKEFKDVDGHRELILHKKKTLFKHEGLNTSQALNMTPVIERGATCSCDSINATQERYLIMGNKRDDQIIVTFGMVWNRRDKEFKKGIHAIRKGNTCEGIFRELSANSLENKPSVKGKTSSSKKKTDKKGKKGNKGKKGKKGKGKKGKKKGKKGNKEKGKKSKNKKEVSSTASSGRASSSKSAVEDQAINNFKRAAD